MHNNKQLVCDKTKIALDHIIDHEYNKAFYLIHHCSGFMRSTLSLHKDIYCATNGLKILEELSPIQFANCLVNGYYAESDEIFRRNYTNSIISSKPIVSREIKHIFDNFEHLTPDLIEFYLVRHVKSFDSMGSKIRPIYIENFKPLEYIPPMDFAVCLLKGYSLIEQEQENRELILI